MTSHNGELIINEQNGIVQIPVPVPLALKNINVYLFRGSDGWRVIDTGLDTQQARELWMQAFAQLKINPQRDIAEIILTHYHPDHLGLAGWMQQLTEAPVRMSPVGIAAVDTMWKNFREQALLTNEFFANYGMPLEQTASIEQHMVNFMRYISPLPELTVLKDRDTIALNDGLFYTALDTPGHCDGHLAFYSEKTGDMIAGDQILLKISPNISLWPNFDPNPLQSYIRSLKELSTLDIRTVFPGHGRIFTTGTERVQELLLHHEERIEEIVGYFQQDEALDGYQVCMKLFGHRDLDLHQVRFAMSEALAHLVYMETQELLKRETDSATGIIRFTLK